MSAKLEGLLADLDKKTPFNDNNDMKQALNQIISTEHRKRLSKADTDLIDECVDLLLEIENINTDELKEAEKASIDRVLRELRERQKNKISRKRPKRAAIVACAIISVFAVTITTAAALGYNLFDLIWQAISSPEETVTDDNNTGDVIWTKDGVYIYTSMIEMLETGNLNIDYPTELPEGYEFTDFQIIKAGSHFEILAYADNPYISFKVEVGTNQVYTGDYSHEVNGIKYNITVKDEGLYQAWWLDSENHYSIVVSDETKLSEIISNLKES